MKRKSVPTVMEYPDSPSGYVRLQTYKEPFMPYEAGHGYLGVLLFNGKDGLVQCHLCGEWKKSLPGHLWKEHNIRSAEYKETVGLAPKAALVSEKVRDTLIVAGQRRSKMPDYYKHRGQNCTKAAKIKQKATYAKNVASMEYKNYKGTCPLQLLDRLKKLANQLGRSPTLREVGFRDALVRTYGSMEEAYKKTGLVYRKAGENVKHFKRKEQFTKEMVRTAIVQFIRTHGRKPTKSDCLRKLVPSIYLIRKHFGSFAKLSV